jgi:hypothetical protein
MKKTLRLHVLKYYSTIAMEKAKGDKFRNEVKEIEFQVYLSLSLSLLAK